MKVEDDVVGILLNDVGSILSEQEIEFRSGKNFNIFEVLSVEQKELIHSRVIATLLSNEGSHGLGLLPLKLFFKLLRNFPGVDDYLGWSNEANSGKYVNISTEKYIGEIDSHYENGGIIDILVEFDNVKISIENKIRAGDQEHQLYRYAKWLKDQGQTKGLLIYLTPDGHHPSDKSTKNGCVKSLDDNAKTPLPRYMSLSYTFIGDWLRQILDSHSDVAQDKVIDFIHQYKEVIDAMSAETTNYRVRECLKPGKLAIAEAIANEYQRAKDEAIRELLAGALRNVPNIEKQVENFSCQRSSDKNPLSLSPQLTRNFGVAICIYQDHLCIGLISPDGEVSTKQRKSLREKAESESRNGYNATRLDEASECWPVSVSSQEAITGSFLDADRKEELKDEICRWYKFLTSSGVKEVFR